MSKRYGSKGSLSELDKLKMSQREKKQQEEVLRQLEEDNKDIVIIQPSLYINTQVSLIPSVSFFAYPQPILFSLAFVSSHPSPPPFLFLIATFPSIINNT